MRYSPEQLRELIARGELHAFYGSHEWRKLAKSVIKSARKECALCKKEHRLTRATTVHHIRHLKDAPELAYERSNLMPLCHDCHERMHKRGVYAEPKGFVNEEKW